MTFLCVIKSYFLCFRLLMTYIFSQQKNCIQQQGNKKAEIHQVCACAWGVIARYRFSCRLPNIKITKAAHHVIYTMKNAAPQKVPIRSNQQCREGNSHNKSIAYLRQYCHGANSRSKIHHVCQRKHEA